MKIIKSKENSFYVIIDKKKIIIIGDCKKDYSSKLPEYQIEKIDKISIEQELKLLAPQIKEELEYQLYAAPKDNLELFLKEDEIQAKINGEKVSDKTLINIIENKLNKYMINNISPFLKENNLEVIYGKEIKKQPNYKIKKLNKSEPKAIIQGQIFDKKKILTRNGSSLIILSVTDYEGSITAKTFLNGDNDLNVKKGDWVKIQGSVSKDNYTKEYDLYIKNLNKFTPPIKKDTAKNKRIELHLHTKMSAMDCVADTEQIIKKAAEWNHPAVAITDHGVVQAFPDAYEAGKKYGIKIIYGLEAYVVDDSDKKSDWKKTPSRHTTILAKNQEGIKDLYKLVSESHLNYFYRSPRILKSKLEKNRKNLLIGTACEAGELYKAIINKKTDKEIEQIAKFYDYFEIQPLGNNEFMVGSQVGSLEDLKNINRKIIEIANKLNKIVVGTGDVHFIEKKDEIYRKILQSGQGYKNTEQQAPLYFRTTEEMLEEFNYLDKEIAEKIVIKNPQKINNVIDDNIKPIPEKLFTPKIEGAEEEVRTLTYKKAKELYGNPLPERIEKRIKKELDSIIGNGYAVTYLISHKLVKKSLEDGYLVGSRGSVGSSLVATLCEITEVNPLPAHYRCPSCAKVEFVDREGITGADLPDKICPGCGEKYIKDGFDIPFEVFLGFKGDKVPDIDLNFSGEYQNEIHKYTEKIFGEKQVYRAGTISTIANRTAYGFVMGYLKDNELEENKAEISRLVNGCVGVRRTTGQHPGGLMIVPEGMEMEDFSPVQKPANDRESDVKTTHFDYHAISGRILKLDLLGHDDPTNLRMLQDLTGVIPSTIPLDDPKTMSIFSSTKALGVSPKQIDSTIGTFGVPEFGTSFVRQMLVDTRPKTLAELVRISGLSHGTDVWLNNAQDIIKKGKATLAEVISVRDDIMNYLISKGVEESEAFWIMEHVRKGKGLAEEEIATMKKHDVPNWYIDSCKKIKYMFPKAHAAAYVTMAFRIAYFKVHYPEAFYTAYFSIKSDYFDFETIQKGLDYIKKLKNRLQNKENLTQKEKGTLTILEVVVEAMARGIKFKKVDIYKSEVDKFILTEDGLVPPLISLDGLGSSAAKSIVEERKKSDFMSIEDFKKRCKVNKNVIKILKKYDVLGDLQESNQISLW